MNVLKTKRLDQTRKSQKIQNTQAKTRTQKKCFKRTKQIKRCRKHHRRKDLELITKIQIRLRQHEQK